jgi:acyl-CoA reductase-like NAD-dependent aldehyde dehydrogenase
VQSSVYDKFLGIMKEKVASYQLGDGFDPASSAGPLVRFCTPKRMTSDPSAKQLIDIRGAIR